MRTSIADVRDLPKAPRSADPASKSEPDESLLGGTLSTTTRRANAVVTLAPGGPCSSAGVGG
ncbi:MAG: hypothetical protein ACXV77_12255, partial [Acidimicrobiia bacterium]